MFGSEFCQLFQNTFFMERFLVTASEYAQIYMCSNYSEDFWAKNEKPLKIDWRLVLQNQINCKMSKLIKSHTLIFCFFSSTNLEIHGFHVCYYFLNKKWRIKT